MRGQIDYRSFGLCRRLFGLKMGSKLKKQELVYMSCIWTLDENTFMIFNFVRVRKYNYVVEKRRH